MGEVFYCFWSWRYIDAFFFIRSRHLEHSKIEREDDDEVFSKRMTSFRCTLPQNYNDDMEEDLIRSIFFKILNYVLLFYFGRVLFFNLLYWDLLLTPSYLTWVCFSFFLENKMIAYWRWVFIFLVRIHIWWSGDKFSLCVVLGVDS